MASSASASKLALVEDRCGGLLHKTWVRNRKKWQSLFPWLHGAFRGGIFGLGCIACHKKCPSQSANGTFATFSYSRQPLFRGLFQQHGRSMIHRFAMGEIAIARDEAPTLAEFQAVLESVLRNDSNQPGGHLRPDSFKKKRKRMVFCISEAARRLDRDVFGRAASTTLMQDVRKSKLLIRFKTSYRVCGRLKMRRGVLGQISVKEGGAINLRNATAECLRRAAQPCFHMPNKEISRIRFKFNNKLLKRLVKSIHFYTADAASEEQLCGKILRDGFAKDEVPRLLDNLLLIVKDRPHATRRITKRGWMADPILNACLQVFIWQPKSMTNLIQYSSVFQSWFEQAIQAMERHPVKSARLKNLRFAKQRFESTQKPLGRLVLLWEVVVAVAVRIYTTRPNPEKGYAKIFLKFASPETALQIALMADAGDESMVLTRTSDKESMDALKFPAHLDEYLHRCRVLFDPSCTYCFDSGYTKYMVENLASPMVINVDGEVRVLGGPGSVTEEIKARVCGRLQNWLVLAKATIQAEFPDFQFAQALRVMDEIVNMPDGELASRQAHISGKLSTLARTCGYDGDTLVAEARRLTPAVHANR